MRRVTVLLATLALCSSALSVTLSAQETNKTYRGVIGKTLSQSKEWWPDPVKAPTGAPNVIWILLDDVGFGASSTFGGLVRTPVFDSLAAQGLRYTNFHTTGICAPTRAAMLTGRNHHEVHMGAFAHTQLSAGFPGYDGRMPAEKGTVAEILRANGYNTFAVGKWGLTPDEDNTDAGPFDYWPLGKGFDHFIGFLASKTDQYKPALVEDNAHVVPDGRHLSEIITDKAIDYLTRQNRVAPDKPFFLYYSPGAVHAPIQVPVKWMVEYKGKFDEGWDVYREKVLANQKKSGIIPAGAKLPARDLKVKAWNSLTKEEKKLCARHMEAFAGFLTYTDYEVGRIINCLKTIGKLNNTLIMVVVGDNGASKEGTQFGAVNKWGPFGKKTSEKEAFENSMADLDAIGDAEGKQTNIPIGWAQATNTPFRGWKMDVDTEGAIRNPLIIFYPNGISAKGGIRTQYGHVIDLLPTTLDFIGIKPSSVIRGIKQDSIRGTSLHYSADDPKAPSRHTEQYYYIFGARSIYKDGWKAGASHHPDYNDINGIEKTAEPNYDTDEWNLFNLNDDFNEQTDVSSKYPEKLQELKNLFDAAARRYQVYPFIDWTDVLNKRIHPAEKK